MILLRETEILELQHVCEYNKIEYAIQWLEKNNYVKYQEYEIQIKWAGAHVMNTANSV